MKQHLQLHTGQEMPLLGLGTWNSPPGEVARAVEHALLRANYDHIDCAKVYGNEPEIGGAFQQVFSSGKRKRTDVFITSKLWNTDHDPADVAAACRQTLADLQLEYLDLYLMHWGVAFKQGVGDKPMGRDGEMELASVPLVDTWRAMEQLVEEGLVKAIGVANFGVAQLLDLLTYANIKPAVNQVELHPYNSQPQLVAFCQRHDVQLTGYSPLGSPGLSGHQIRLLDEPVLVSIAAAHGKTPAQVALNWNAARNVVVIPKSTTPERIDQNGQIFDFELTPEEREQIDVLNRNYRFVNPAVPWGLPYFA